MADTSADALKEATVLERTGKSRSAWHGILDEFGCREKGHTASAKFLESEHGLTPWWSQSITVDYERERGIREVGQRSSGKFAINVSRTIAAPLSDVWAAWADAGLISKWFTTEHRHEFIEGGGYKNADGDRGVYKRIDPLRRIHLTWDNAEHCPGSLVIVEFFAKGDSKSTVAITHEKLADKKGSEEMKEGWSWALDSLKSFLESGQPIRFEDWKKGRT